MKCKKCGAENPEGAKFCYSCGSKLGGNECPKCGATNPEEAKFCNTCGASLAKDDVFEAKPAEDTIRCRICGYVNKSSESYCKACGSQLEQSFSSGTYSSSTDNIYNEQDTSTPGFVVGIVSIIASITCCLSVVAVITGIVGIILNAKTLAKKTGNKTKATVGLVLSIIGLVISIVEIISSVAVLNNPEFWEEYRKQMESLYGQGYDV